MRPWCFYRTVKPRWQSRIFFFFWWDLAAACDRHRTPRHSHMARLLRGHGSSLTVQPALPSVFLFVHSLWAYRWPSSRLLAEDKTARFPPNGSTLKASRHFWQNSAVMSQRVCEILKGNLLGWPTIISCHWIQGGAAFRFCPPLSLGRPFSFCLHPLMGFCTLLQLYSTAKHANGCIQGLKHEA